jgi:hypothetical protein
MTRRDVAWFAAGVVALLAVLFLLEWLPAVL